METIGVLLSKPETKEIFNQNDIDFVVDVAIRELGAANKVQARVETLKVLNIILDNEDVVLLKQMQRAARVADDEPHNTVIHRVAGGDGVDVDRIQRVRLADGQRQRRTVGIGTAHVDEARAGGVFARDLAEVDRAAEVHVDREGRVHQKLTGVFGSDELRAAMGEIATWVPLGAPATQAPPATG